MGAGVTPSGPNTAAGLPLAASSSVTRAPATGVLLRLSKITPEGSTRISVTTRREPQPRNSTVSVSSRVVSMKPFSTPTGNCPASRVGRPRSTRKTPVFGPVSTTTMLSRSPVRADVITTTLVSMTSGMALHGAESAWRKMGWLRTVLLMGVENPPSRKLRIADGVPATSNWTGLAASVFGGPLAVSAYTTSAVLRTGPSAFALTFTTNVTVTLVPTGRLGKPHATLSTRSSSVGRAV